MEIELNKNDTKLMAFCKDRPKTIKEISEHLGIAQKNVFARIPKLERAKIIQIKKSPSLKKVFVKTIQNETIEKYILQFLKTLEEKGGEMSFQDFCNLAPIDPFDPESYDRSTAFNSVMYSSPPLVNKKFYLTEEGKKFLKSGGKEK